MPDIYDQGEKIDEESEQSFFALREEFDVPLNDLNEFPHSENLLDFNWVFAEFAPSDILFRKPSNQALLMHIRHCPSA